LNESQGGVRGKQRDQEGVNTIVLFDERYLLIPGRGLVQSLRDEDEKARNRKDLLEVQAQGG